MSIIYNALPLALDAAFWHAQKTPSRAIMVCTRLQITTHGTKPTGFECITIDTAEAILSYYTHPRQAILTVTYRNYPPAKHQFDLHMCGIGTELTVDADLIIQTLKGKDTSK